MATGWVLIDQPDLPDDGENSVPILSEDELRTKLRADVNRPPHVLILKSSAGPTVFVGIGGPVAGVLCFPKLNSDYSVYAESNYPSSNTDICFLSEGHEQGFPGKCLMPPEDAIRLSCEIYTTGRLPDWVKWGRGWENRGLAEDLSPESEDNQGLREIPF